MQSTKSQIMGFGLFPPCVPRVQLSPQQLYFPISAAEGTAPSPFRLAFYVAPSLPFPPLPSAAAIEPRHLHTGHQVLRQNYETLRTVILCSL